MSKKLTGTKSTTKKSPCCKNCTCTPKKSTSKKKKGFTLIELIIVIVILGILAAFLIPTLTTSAKDARIATIQGLAGTLSGASVLAHGSAMANGVSNGGTITLEDGSTIVKMATSNLYPLADAAMPASSAAATAGILNMLSCNNSGGGTACASINGFKIVFNSGVDVTFQKTGAPDMATCFAKYSNSGTNTGVPAITTDTAGC